MKLVWKCDYCSTTGTKEDVKVHENKCTFNPRNRTCHSCDNRIQSKYYDGSDECEIHDWAYFFDVDDGDKKCNDWTNSKIRTKKLKKIIENINEST